MTKESVCISFQDNRLLPQLFGEQDKHLSKLEQQLHVTTSSRGNIVSIEGASGDINLAESVLRTLYEKLELGQDVSEWDVDALIKMHSENTNEHNYSQEGEMHMVEPSRTGVFEDDLVIATQKKPVHPYTRLQAEYIKALLENEVVFAAGPAGTGKTYLAVAAAVSMFISQKVDRIILCRPAVEAGEHLGFLPGDMREKVDPYLRPLYDALYDMLPAEKVMKCIETGEIEIAPLAFMRGRTLRHSFVILDEAQNASAIQMKMFLTRLGENSHMSVTGDLSQIDLPSHVTSGFKDALDKLKDIEEVSIIRFGDKDIVRHPLTVKIVQAYERHERDET